ncbi:ABC transporter substrate-binding protein, partial [Paucilactobacillus wasatchensis]|uniref:ABC transporter substrate-binding protein n=1 Tax=Paucilactobacillus wasatchensis TaxID=1335616 RepID=UPI0005C5F25A
MKKFMKVATVMMAMATVGSTLAGCSSAKSEGNTAGKTIKIGVNMELSGAAAAYGAAEKQGIELAAQQINKAGGIKVGNTKKKIKVIYRDNKTSTSESSSVAAQLVNNDKVQAVIGPATTNAGTAAIPNITKAKVPAISPSASDYSYTLTKAGKVQPYVFRTEYQNNFQGKIVSNFMSKTLKTKW